MGVIYKITSPSGRIYIGKSKNLKKRIKDYKYQCEKRKSIVHDSIRGYGWDNHTLEIIEECADELLSEREIFWIKELKSYWLENQKGMNMTRGGEAGGGSWMWDTKRRKYFSELYKGEGSPFYGKHHTEETKKYLSKLTRERHIERGTKIPVWGVEKMLSNKRKPVVVYLKDGAFFNEYISLSEASRKLNINLGSCKDSVLYGSWINGEYLLKYKTENYPLNIEVGEIKMKSVKRRVLTLTSDYEIVCEHPSAKEASDFWGIPRGTINRAAMYNWLVPIRTGHVFIYSDLYEKIIAAEEAA
jgi:group I intron endonuclease